MSHIEFIYFIKKISPPTIYKGIGILLGLIFSVILARHMGPEFIGIFTFSNKISVIILQLSLFGFAPYVVKKCSIYLSKRKFTEIYELNYIVKFYSLVISLFLITLCFFLISILVRFSIIDEGLQIPITILSLSAIPRVISKLNSSLLIAYDKINQSVIIDFFVYNFLNFIFILILYICDYKINTNLFFYFILGNYVITFFYAEIFRKKNKLFYKSNFNKSFSKLISETADFFSTKILQVLHINLSLLILGSLMSLTELGFIAIPFRIALAMSIISYILAQIYSPLFSKLYSDLKINVIVSELNKLRKNLFLISFLIFFFFLIFGKSILLVWGYGFDKYYIELVIMIFMQCFHINTGLFGTVLLMSGHEHILKKIELTSLILSVILQILMFSIYGVIGLVISYAFFDILKNSVKYYFYRKIVITNNND